MTTTAPPFDGQTENQPKTGEKWQPVIDPAKRPRFDMSMTPRHNRPRNLPREMDQVEAKAEKKARRMRNQTARQIAADMDAEAQEEGLTDNTSKGGEPDDI